MLDSQHHIETPEGIDLGLAPAGAIPRALAFTIDSLIRWVVVGALSIPLAFLDKVGMALMLLVYFFSEWFYPVFFEVLNQGMTPGKKYLKIRVINDDGTPIGWSASIVRNLLRAVDFFPVFYGAGFITMLFNRNNKRLGDLAAGTLVVYHADKVAPIVDQSIEARALPVPLSLDEREAVINFADRSAGLSSERNNELANILSPMLHTNDEQAVVELKKIARGLVS